MDQEDELSLGELRDSWNYLYAQRIVERAGWAKEDALKAAEAADDAYNDNIAPDEAADEEMACWTNDE